MNFEVHTGDIRRLLPPVKVHLNSVPPQTDEGRNGFAVYRGEIRGCTVLGPSNNLGE